MTHSTLARLLERLLEEMEGSDGFWHGQRDDVTVYVVSDLEHDRMRIMAPIGELRINDAGFLSILLQANFDRALDAKYALRKKELWSVFMHPLSTVVPDDLGLYIDQVVRLVKNTGSTYAQLVEGYEFSLTANPTRNWNVQASFSYTDGYTSEVAPEVQAWAATEIPFFRRFDQNISTAQGTIAQVLEGATP